LDRETASIALVLTTALAVLAAVYPVLPTNGQPFSELGVLGPSQQIGGYPTNVTSGQQIHLYGYIGDHEGGAAYYQFVVKLGNASTSVSNSTAASAPVIFTRYQVLDDNQTTTFPVTLAVTSVGTNQRLIFELWSFNETTTQFSYTGLYNQLYLNVTRS
jgi:uncharacterized membrane protein